MWYLVISFKLVELATVLMVQIHSKSKERGVNFHSHILVRNVILFSVSSVSAPNLRLKCKKIDYRIFIRFYGVKFISL